MSPRLGVVADDVTGACDLADAVRSAGWSVVVLLGVPAPQQALPACDCAVVALRTRTAPLEAAVGDSTAAARWLLDRGCRSLYQKYCSTFDSTDEGMVGPVADALRTLLATGGPPVGSVGTPATPRAGRTQYQGHLFVGGRLLSESSLRDHPLTPMRDPDLLRVLGRQTPARVALLSWEDLRSDETARTTLRGLLDQGVGHVLVDALAEDDLDRLADVVASLDDGPDAGTEADALAEGSPRGLLLGGAAGFAGALARRWKPRATTHGDEQTGADPLGPGKVTGDATGVRSLIVSGSCSERTREQVARFDGPRVQLDAVALAADPTELDRVHDAVAVAYLRGDGPVLVSSSAEPAAVRATQERLGVRRTAEVLEHAAGQVAVRAVRSLGVRRLIVAGGETSGAVTAALGLRALRVGPAPAPGVPWMVPVDGPPLAVLLKSGNFGEPDLFRTAWDACP